MKRRHWLRRDIFLPLLYLAAFGAALYWLSGKLDVLERARTSRLIYWLVRGIIGIYLLLGLITISHVLSTYDLERYDPGNLASLKRLMRRSRYKLRNRSIPTQALLVDYEAYLLGKGYQLETDSHIIGRVYARQRRLAFLFKAKYERIILLQHEPLNVFMIDQLLQDSIRYIRQQETMLSQRNLLIIVSRMQEAEEIASCGAGVVNFLGKFKGGSLGLLLLATRHQRLFYPVDRTLLPYNHRCFQNRHRRRLKRMIFLLQSSGVKSARQKARPGNRRQDL